MLTLFENGVHRKLVGRMSTTAAYVSLCSASTRDVRKRQDEKAKAEATQDDTL